MFDWDKVVLCQSWCWYEEEWAERNDCRPADTNLLDVTETLISFHSDVFLCSQVFSAVWQRDVVFPAGEDRAEKQHVFSFNKTRDGKNMT